MPEMIRSNDETMTRPEPGLHRQVMSTSDTMMLVRHRMDAGWVGVAHSHPHEQILYVTSGCIALTTDGRTHMLRAGDSIILPGNMVHQASAPEGDSEALDIFTPAREDYR